MDERKPPWSHAIRPEDAPFHQGERAVQVRAGVRERMARVPPRGFRDAMPDQHRELFAKLPWFLVGSVDENLQPWASVLVGRPGFLRSPDPQTLEVNALPVQGDPLARNLREGAALGGLGIQLETRRRNRVNGVVTELSPGGFTLRVGQSFGNCNQYIQAREPVWVDAASATAAIHSLGPNLPEALRSAIARADTFFIASATPAARGAGAAVHGADVSHRGGNPGFVQISERAGQTVLTLPDYPGNNFFNTLGNLELWPHAGLLFIDFQTGDTISLAADSEVLWEGPELAGSRGAERLLRVAIRGGVWIERALPLRWSAPRFAQELIELRA